MADYCTIEQLVGATTGTAITGYLPQVSADEDKEKLKGIITRVSRRIDAYVTDGQREDFFAASPFFGFTSSSGTDGAMALYAVRSGVSANTSASGRR